MKKIKFPEHINGKVEKAKFILAALTGRLYGNSMSYTILTMAQHNIPTWCVKAIISSTAAEDDTDFEGVIESYSGITWGGFERDPEMVAKCTAIARKMWAKKKIIQPRLILANKYSPAAISHRCLCQNRVHLDTLHKLVEYEKEYTPEQMRIFEGPHRGLQHNRWVVKELKKKKAL